MSIDLRFLNSRATCALCGREVDPDEATLIAQVDEPDVESSVCGTHLHLDVVPCEQLVICPDCEAGRAE